MDPTGLRFYVASRAGMLATITRDYAPTCQSSASTRRSTRWSRSRCTCSDANGDPFTIEKVRAPGRRAARRDRQRRRCSTARSPTSSARTRSRTARRRRAAGSPARRRRSRSSVAGPVADPRRAEPERRRQRPGRLLRRPGLQRRQRRDPARGAVRSRATGLDENCDGTAEPFPTLTSGVVSKWDVKGTVDADDAAGHAAVPEGLEGADQLPRQAEVHVQVQDAEGRQGARGARRRSSAR